MLQVEDYISKIGEYFEGIERYNDALIVRVKLPERWGVYPSSDERIKVAPSEEVPNEYYYYGSSNDVNLEDIFQLIIETIQMNKDVLLKIELLKEKVQELKELFDTKPLEELKTLKFVTEQPKKTKAKRKYTKKKKVAETEDKQPIDKSSVPSIAPSSNKNEITVEPQDETIVYASKNANMEEAVSEPMELKPSLRKEESK